MHQMIEPLVVTKRDTDEYGCNELLTASNSETQSMISTSIAFHKNKMNLCIMCRLKRVQVAVVT